MNGPNLSIKPVWDKEHNAYRLDIIGSPIGTEEDRKLLAKVLEDARVRLYGKRFPEEEENLKGIRKVIGNFAKRKPRAK